MVLGGGDEDPAITWQGRTLRYHDLAALVDAVPVPPGGVIDTGIDLASDGRSPEPGAGPDLVTVLAAVFAAAQQGCAVLVRATGGCLPDREVLPPGTWLAAQTSGTSGRPRVVCRTAASWADSFGALADLAGLTARDSVLITGSLTATMHLFAAVHTLAIGAQVTDRPAEATAVHAVPQRLATLLDQVPPSAKLRTAVTAGAPLPDALAQRCLRRGIAVTEYYGAAELSFVAARRAPDPLRPFPGVLVRVDAAGVLWARSDYLALGYATDGAGDCSGNGARRDAGPLVRDDDGFATVGDLASLAGDGTVTIRGRGSTAILTGGHTVLAEDVEAVLGAVPGVAAVVAVGLAHPRFGQIVVAVLEPEVDADLSTVPPIARDRLGAGRPRRYLVCDRLPRTAGGKIARAAVAAGLADGSFPATPLHPRRP